MDSWGKYEHLAEHDGDNHITDFHDVPFRINRPCWNPRTFFEFMAAKDRDDFVNACGAFVSLGRVKGVLYGR